MNIILFNIMIFPRSLRAIQSRTCKYWSRNSLESSWNLRPVSCDLPRISCELVLEGSEDFLSMWGVVFQWWLGYDLILVLLGASAGSHMIEVSQMGFPARLRCRCSYLHSLAKNLLTLLDFFKFYTDFCDYK